MSQANFVISQGKMVAMSHVMMQIKRYYRDQQNETRQKANKLWEDGCHLISAAESVFEQHAVVVNKASLISRRSSTKGM